MRLSSALAAAAVALAACETREPEASNGLNAVDPTAAATPSPSTPPAEKPKESAAGWDLQSSGEGAALVLLSTPGRAAIRLFCPAGEDRLLVNVPSFKPVGSEERLSFGSGGEATALVADTRGDRQRGGVSGTGTVPADLQALIRGPISASYGAQASGPHPAPPPELARGFVAACREGKAEPQAPKTAIASAGPCLMQDGRRIDVPPRRAVGTEPFWGARIEGRCVTYSHPEDQRGTRIWTRYVPGADGGGTWSGALAGKRFELKLRPAPGCSDGMSDRRYPLAADLIVASERRSGCAEPL
ncbi:MAG TPA: hypothetical protein VGB59_05530 [Allosphingosinicella sp.]|jgi:uncharacterized membrane protein